MKFSIVALGLLFAGLAHCQLAQPNQATLDGFLRESQHLNPSAELVSIQEHGPIVTVTYKDGPVNVKYDVKSDGDDMRIIGIEQVMTFSGNFQFDPSNILKPNIQIDQLPPLPLLMPQFNVQSNGQVEMTNVFDTVEKQINDMRQKMQQNKMDFIHEMEKKKLQMRDNINKKINDVIKETPLIGGGDHDYNQATQIQIHPNQPLIGGDHDYNSATAEFQNNPLIGGGDHDTWEGKPVDFQAEHLIVGGNGHDNWQNKKKGCHKNRKNQELIGRENHDKGKGCKHKMMKNHQKQGKQHRHHSNAAWMNKQFTKDEILPYMTEKLPDLMAGSEILSVQQKGFEKRKGFKLDIQIRDNQGELQNISVYFKPMRKELSIQKVSKVLLGDGLVHKDDLTKMPQETQVHQDNHISENNKADMSLPGDQNTPQLEKAMKIINEILKKQQTKDIDTVQPTEEVKEQKRQQSKEKLELLTHRR